MRAEFAGKRIAFLGASIVQNGTALDRMRLSLLDTPRAPRLYNRGLGGNRAIMVEGLFRDEILSLAPDACFVHYGVNDMGVWLYDAAREVTAAVEAERRERDEAYRCGIRRTVALLLGAGIRPVLCTPIAVDERLCEVGDIFTVADNEEKGKRIRDTLYTRASFSAINRALKGYRDAVFAIAEERGCEVLDLFSVFHGALMREGGLYAKDGIHLAERGHTLLAECVLSHIGAPGATVSIPLPPPLVALREAEQLERQIQYVKWAMFHPFYGRDIGDPETGARAMLAREGLEHHKRLALTAYLENGRRLDALRARIEEIYP